MLSLWVITGVETQPAGDSETNPATMFIDVYDLPNGHTIEADVCIVGAGAAGISMAREFIGTSKTVALLESGGLEFDPRTQSLYEGRNVGMPSFGVHVNRLRYFGGTTNHWAGHCRPLDPIDFQPRGWIPQSGWPITRAMLDPYYRRAQPLCELGEYRYDDLDYFTDRTGLPALNTRSSRLRSVVYNQSPPTRFGAVYRDELRTAPNMTVYLHANVLELESDAGASTVTGARVASIDGPRVTVKAGIFVLATGGMENPRLLLLSRGASPGGLGNDRDLVGRYFMDHVLLRPGADVALSVPDVNLRLYNALHNVAGGRMFSVLAVANERMQREGLGNFRIHLVPDRLHYEHPLGPVFSVLDGNESPAPAAPEAYGTVGLHVVLEPVPNHESRIMLGQDRDLFGQPRIAVNWQLTEAERRNLRRAMELAAIEFGRMGLGRSAGEIFRDPDHWPRNLEAGKHHCGTTRMSDSPATGVVDSNCRVHGVDNLYVAGSSVFPTIGYANPTLTIVALALRLSDHIKATLT